MAKKSRGGNTTDIASTNFRDALRSYIDTDFRTSSRKRKRI